VIKLVAQRRAEGANGDDLISRLIRAEFEARRLDDMEIATFVRSLVAAGGETTTRTFSSVMTLLLQRFDDRFGFAQWQALSNPDVYLIGNRVERIWSPPAGS